MIPGRILCFTAADLASAVIKSPESSYGTMRLMSDMKDEGVKYFVGLHQSCAQEAALAAAWDFPLLSYVSDPCNNALPLFISLVTVDGANESSIIGVIVVTMVIECHLNYSERMC